MNETTVEDVRVVPLRNTGLDHTLSARASLASGRHADALEALRRARGSRRGGEAPRLALQEAEALFGLQRYREALAVATRALARGPADADLAARLRIARGQALWWTGRVPPARSEVRKAEARAVAVLTRARALETLGFFAWKDQDLDGARAHLETARGLYERCGSTEGMARVLGKEAGALRDAGRLEEALRAQDRGLDLARATSRRDAVASALADRGSLLTALGRWEEARADIEAAAELFREVADPRELTLAGLARAVVELAAGDLSAAQVSLERVRAAVGDGVGNPRWTGDVLLLTSDLRLAAGDAAAADACAVEALGLYGLARDAEGMCRSRARRAHALLALGRLQEAVREGRRALASAAPSRTDLTALASIALGRGLLRHRPAEAREEFDRAAALSATRPVFMHAARLGRALAAGARRDDPEITASLAALEAWGDRRVLACCLAEVRRIFGVPASTGRIPAAQAPPGGTDRDAAAALVDAAVALLGEGDWPARCAAAMRAIRRVSPWWRAALVAGSGWELRPDLGDPGPLPPSDLARDLAARSTGPGVVDLLADPLLREDPVRVLHGLARSIVCPVGEDATLCLDYREGTGAGEEDLGVAIEVARLLSCHLPPPAPPPREAMTFPELVGRGPAMQALFAEMSRVTHSEVSVHIFGETGTGKERVAAAIHRRSRRSGGPFVAINASSLSDELFEAEMFGHARGAFTGAVSSREGYVARAEGGTLFIDEVADLTPRAQAKLLRIVQEKEYRRLGETETRRANVRVLSAANADLEQRVGAGLFREDLMYRLRPIVLALPPLRERGGDLLLLARHFVSLAASREAVAPPPLPADVVRALAAHPWPGNIRELENEMSRLVVLAGRGPIRREHLSPRVAGASPAGRSCLRDARHRFERDFVARALSRNGGNRTRTACELGVTRQALISKIRRLGL